MAAFQAAARFWLEQDEEIIKREPPPVPVKPSRLMRKLSEGSMKRSAIVQKPRIHDAAVTAPAAEPMLQPTEMGDLRIEEKKLAPSKRSESKRTSILSKSPFGKRKKSKSKKGTSSGSGLGGRDRSISSPVAVSSLPLRSASPVARTPASPREMLEAAGGAGCSLNVAQQVENVPRQRHVISSPSLSQRPKRAVSKDALKNIIFELIDTERDYLVDLQIIEDILYTPIEKLQLLSPADCSRLFGNVRHLIPVHVRLLQQLEEAEKKSPDAVNVGRCIIGEAESLKLYESYCTNQPRALELFEQLRSNENLMSYLAIAAEKPECRGLDLNAFLIKPLQRICKYPLLLRELVKQTPVLPAGPYEDLILAEEKVKEIVSYINESKREKEMFEQMIDLQRKIQAATGKHIGIMDADRRLLQSGDVVVITKQFRKVPALFTLFNNLLVLVKPSFKLYAYVPLGEALINHVGIHDVPYSLEVVHAGNKKLWLSFPTQQECMDLFSKLSELVEVLLKEQMAWYNEPKRSQPPHQQETIATMPRVDTGCQSPLETFDSFSSKPLPKPPASPRRIDAVKPATPPKPRRYSMPPKAKTTSPAAPSSPSPLVPKRPNGAMASQPEALPLPVRSYSAGGYAQVPSVKSVTLVAPSGRDSGKPVLRPEDRQSYRELVRHTVAKAASAEDSVEITCKYQGKELPILLPISRQTYSLFRQRLCRQLKVFAFKARSPSGNLVTDQASLDVFLSAGVLVLDCDC